MLRRIIRSINDVKVGHAGADYVDEVVCGIYGQCNRFVADGYRAACGTRIAVDGSDRVAAVVYDIVAEFTASATGVVPTGVLRVVPVLPSISVTLPASAFAIYALLVTGFTVAADGDKSAAMRAGLFGAPSRRKRFPPSCVT